MQLISRLSNRSAAILFGLAVLSLALYSQSTTYTQRQPLMVTNAFGLTSAWAGECAAGVLDNRSANSRQLDYIAVYGSGTGNWSLALNYSDAACSGPWTAFPNAAASINQASAYPVAHGFGYHPFVQIVITGNATGILSGTRNYYPSAP